MKGYTDDETKLTLKTFKGKTTLLLRKDYKDKTAKRKDTKKTWKAIKAIVVASRRSDGSDGLVSDGQIR